jgi:hypothetical protein
MTPVEKMRLKKGMLPPDLAPITKLPTVSGAPAPTTVVSSIGSVPFVDDDESTIAQMKAAHEADKAKASKQRKCCATTKGQSPHLPTCKTLRRSKTKDIGATLPGGRFPVGTKIEKVWGGETWHCTITVPCMELLFVGEEGGSFHCEVAAAKAYLKMLQEKDGATIDKSQDGAVEQ